MAETKTQSNGAESTMKPLLDFWSEWAEQNQEQTRTLLEGFKGATDVKALRQFWLNSLSDSLDGYMRTPAFLEGMRRNFEAMTRLKSAGEEVARDVARATGVPR